MLSYVEMLMILSMFIIFPLVSLCTLMICSKMLMRYFEIRQNNYIILVTIYILILIGCTALILSPLFANDIDLFKLIIKIVLSLMVLTNFIMVYLYYSYFSKRIRFLIYFTSILICAELHHLIISKEILSIFIISDGNSYYFVFSFDAYFQVLMFLYILLCSILILRFIINLIEISQKWDRVKNLIQVHALMILFIILFFLVFESSRVLIPYQVLVFFYFLYILVFLLQSISLSKNLKIQIFMDQIILSDVIIFNSKGIILYKHSKSRTLTTKFLQNSMIVGFSQLYSAVRMSKDDIKTYIKSIHIGEFHWVYHFYLEYEIGVLVVCKTEYSLIKERLDFFFKIMEKDILNDDCLKKKNDSNAESQSDKGSYNCKINVDKVDELLEKIFRISILDEFSIV